jgi:hypothetical protein
VELRYNRAPGRCPQSEGGGRDRCFRVNREKVFCLSRMCPLYIECVLSRCFRVKREIFGREFCFACINSQWCPGKPRAPTRVRCGRERLVELEEELTCMPETSVEARIV